MAERVLHKIKKKMKKMVLVIVRILKVMEAEVPAITFLEKE